MNCPLCNMPDENLFAAGGRTYHRCCKCGLVYMDATDRLLPDEEKKRYSFHQNSISDAGYVAFLNRVIEPSMQYISKGMKGLDYGCGPNPVLAQIVGERGMQCSYYDPFFFPECKADAKYDFVFATECFEHFFSPMKEIEKICAMLNSNGILGIMTELMDESTDFDNWYYKNDPTHVCFYGKESINYICQTYNFKQLFNDNHRVIILRKS
jgi:hypothetical protein